MERPDIMSHIICAKKDGNRLPIDIIHGTFLSLAIAGSETTASSLSGITNYLVNNPEKLDILKMDIRRRFQNENEISLDSLRDLEYLNAVIKEGLRLCPPVPWVLPRRVPPGGHTVCGVWLPGNVRDSTWHSRKDTYRRF